MNRRGENQERQFVQKGRTQSGKASSEVDEHPKTACIRDSSHPIALPFPLPAHTAGMALVSPTQQSPLVRALHHACRSSLARGGSGGAGPSHAEKAVGVGGKAGAKWRNQSDQLRAAMATTKEGPQVAYRDIHPCTDTHAYSLTHSFTRSCIHTHYTHTHTHTHSHSLTPSLNVSLTHSQSLPLSLIQQMTGRVML